MRPELAAAQETIAALTGQVALLKRVQEVDGQRATDSHTSSTPPSRDGPTRVPPSLRGTSGKTPGGQSGHRGGRLRLVDTPDRVVVQGPTVCPQGAAGRDGGGRGAPTDGRDAAGAPS